MNHSELPEHGHRRAIRGRILLDLHARTFTLLGATADEREALDLAAFAALRCALGVFDLHSDAGTQEADREIVRRREASR